MKRINNKYWKMKGANREIDCLGGISGAPHAASEIRPPLPVSAQPLLGESLTSLLLRIAEINCLHGISALLRATGIVAYGPLISHEINALARLCRLSPSTIRHMCPVEIGGYGRGEAAGYVIYGNRLPSGHLIVRNRERVCPLCIRERGYLLAEHGLALMTVCPIHHVRLIDRCGGCRALIRLSRPRLATCRCGFSFATMKVVGGTREEQYLGQMLHGYWIRSISSTIGSQTIADYRIPEISTLGDALVHLMTMWPAQSEQDLRKAPVDDVRCEIVPLIRRLMDAPNLHSSHEPQISRAHR